MVLTISKESYFGMIGNYLEERSFPLQSEQRPSLKKEQAENPQRDNLPKRPRSEPKSGPGLQHYFPVKRKKDSPLKVQKAAFVPYQEIILKEVNANHRNNPVSYPTRGSFSDSSKQENHSPVANFEPIKSREKALSKPSGMTSLDDFIEAKDIELLPQSIRNVIGNSLSAPHSISTSRLDLYHGYPICDLRYAFISKKIYAELLVKHSVPLRELGDHPTSGTHEDLPRLCNPYRSLMDELLSQLVYDFSQFNLPESSPEYEEVLLQLREFDGQTFGPYSGLTRLERFERSQRAGAHPPSHLKKILLSLQGHQDSKLKFSSYSKL